MFGGSDLFPELIKFVLSSLDVSTHLTQASRVQQTATILVTSRHVLASKESHSRAKFVVLGQANFEMAFD